MDSTDIKPETSRWWTPALFSAALALALHAVTLAGTYIYDDLRIVAEDPRVQEVHWWGLFWTQAYCRDAIDNLYRPLVSQSYGLQWWLDGGRPWPFHLLNILLHAGAAALVAELARRLAGWRVGLIAGLIFAAHPIHVEAVAEIVGRADLACTAAIVGACVLFLHRPMTIRRAVAIGALGIVAMLCKESGLLIPALLLAMALFRRFGMPAQRQLPPNASPQPEQPNAIKWLVAIVGWSCATMIVLREQVLHLPFEWDTSFLDWTIQPMILSHGIDRVLLPLLLLGRYARLLLWPSRLSIDYGMAVIGPHASWSNPFVLTGIACAAAWTLFAAISLHRRAWALLSCLVAAAISYAMVSNVILIGTVFGERLMYLPSVFILICVATAIARLPKPAAWTLVALAVALTSYRTVTYASRWNDRDQFYETSLSEQPLSIRLHELVAHRAMVRGDFARGREVMADACRIQPDYFDNWSLAAQIEMRAGNWPQAVAFATKAYHCQANIKTIHLLTEVTAGATAATRATTRTLGP